MLILELSRRSGVTRHTIRYYEKLGLIRAAGRRDNSYKEYSEDTLYALIFVNRVKRLGFSLSEIQDFLKVLGQSKKAASRVIEQKLASKLEEVDRKLEALTELRGNVSVLLNHCRSNPYKGQENIRDLVLSLEEKTGKAGKAAAKGSSSNPVSKRRRGRRPAAVG